MTAGAGWIEGFPLSQASRAVHALRLGWEFFAKIPRSDFHRGIPEPKLTRVLLNYVDRVVARQQGLLGYWGTEGVENEVDFASGRILNEHRTDILYHWNSETFSMRLVFEFKKLDRRSASRSHYLGKKGLLRFVTGPYSRQEPVAAMVGILTEEEDVVLPGLYKALQNRATCAATQLCPRDDGSFLHRPSLLFPENAKFDTEHLRSPELGPKHGTIRVSHMFFAFGYQATSAEKMDRRTLVDKLETED